MLSTPDMETLRYFGLPFARVRRVMGSERVWFGVEGSRRRMLDEKNETEFANLITDLMEHRSAGNVDHTTHFTETRVRPGSSRCCAATLPGSIQGC